MARWTAPHMETTMKELAQSWVKECATLPVAFAQVREDALIDLSVCSTLGERLDVAMIASGGCTSAALVSSGRLASLKLVDCNLAQLALTRLKIDLLQNAGTNRRMQVLGHAPMQPLERKLFLTEALAGQNQPSDTFGPIDFVAGVGPDHCGRYERVFHELQQRLIPHQTELLGLLRRRSTAIQSRCVRADTPLGAALDTAFDDVMALPNLVALFGQSATNNRVMPFGRHFAWRTRHALETLPARSNPYVSQVLSGRFVGGTTFPWLKMPKARNLPKMQFAACPMQDALKEHRSSFDLVHLSNILDWLSRDDAVQTLEVAHRALRPGGLVLIRQLNSNLDVAACGAGFRWLTNDARRLHGEDRSYFYRHLHLGRKR
jgi:S-adenosylmethionine-diacylglycerol 3-amino-3-carboxypropyl transferase